MKTVLLTLEPHDDILSVLDRLAWAKAPRVLLIWPKEGCGLERRLDFVLLARRARALNLRVALVTQDRRVRALAAEAGLAVFATRQEALRRAWLRRRRRRPRRPPPRDLQALHTAVQRLRTPKGGRLLLRLLAFTTAVLAVLALAAFTLPGATVTLQPRTHWQEVTLTVSASPRVPAPTLDGHVPAHWLSVVVEGEEETPSSGITVAPYKAATAALRFTNLTAHEVGIPAGTVVRSRSQPAVHFILTQGGTVPPQGTLTLVARAAQPGREGNVPAGDLQWLDPPLGLELTVTNPVPATGGQDIPVPAPTQTDRENLRRRLEARLREQARVRLQELAQGQRILWASLERQEVLEARYSTEVGQPAEVLRLTLRVAYRVLAVDPAQLQALAHQVLDARLRADEVPLSATLSVETLDEPRREGDTVRWTIRARRQVMPRVPSEAVALALAGKSPELAQAWLEAHLSLSAAPQIRLTPSWWPRLPWLGFRIRVEVQPTARP